MARATARGAGATLRESSGHSWNRLHLGSRCSRISERSRQARMGQRPALAHGRRAHTAHPPTTSDGAGRPGPWSPYSGEDHRLTSRDRPESPILAAPVKIAETFFSAELYVIDENLVPPSCRGHRDNWLRAPPGESRFVVIGYSRHGRSTTVVRREHRCDTQA